MGNCPIEDRELCKFLGSEGCEKCGINHLGRKADPVAYADTWDVTLSLIPDDIDELHLTDKCRFCKGEPNKKSGYEMLCLKHKEPIHMKGMFFGFGTKVPSDVGSIVDIPIAVCPRCRRRLALDKLVTYVCTGVGALIAVIALVIPGVEKALSSVSWALPLLMLVGLTAAGYGIGRLIKSGLTKKAEKEMFIDPLEIKQISRMVLLGWSPMQVNKRGDISLNFKKEKLRKNMAYKSKDNLQNEE